jgi:hypothetical protein
VKVIVGDGFVPFVDERDFGTARMLAEALAARGHEVEAVRLPRGEDAVRSSVAARLTDVSDAGALLIAVGRPAHLLRHPRKVIWCDGEDFAASPKLRHGDRTAFAEARCVIAASPVARRAIVEWWDGEVLGGEGTGEANGAVDAASLTAALA